MIEVEPDRGAGAGEGVRSAYGLQLLLDQSRLVVGAPAAPAAGDAPHADRVRLRVVDLPAAPDGDATEAFARAMAAHMPRPGAGAAAPVSLAPWFQVGDGEVRVARAALLAAADLAGLRAEQRTAARDRHGRVPAEANPLVGWGLERVPVLAVAGRALRVAALAAAGRRPVRLLAPWPDGHRWAATLTHDLDVVEYWPAFSALRVAELARKRRVGDAARVLAAAVRPAAGGHVLAGARALAAAERARGVRSTWYVLAAAPTLRGMAAGDVTYTLGGRLARRVLAAAREAGAELGLHGSFATSGLDAAPGAGEGVTAPPDTTAHFAAERARVTAVTGAPPVGVRQHYLRFRPGHTHRAMQAAGFAYDATVGFADRNGFRAGVGDVIAAWDDAAGAPLALDLVPLLWMDRALSKYAGVESPDAWVDDALALADACRATEGLWSGLWHPNLVPALGYPGAPAAYERLMDGLLAGRPFVAPSAELVAWRRLRRSCRAVGERPDGTLEYRADGAEANEHPLAFEDADGRPLPARPAPSRPAAAVG